MAAIVPEIEQVLSAARRPVCAGRTPAIVQRVAALELLERHAIDRLQFLDEAGTLAPELLGLLREAETLFAALEHANGRLVEGLRRRIVAGRYTRNGLLRAFACVADATSSQGDYDALDVLVGGLLDVGPLPDEEREREPDMVFYQPTPARAILSLLRLARLGPADVFYDLGSGLGHVVCLAALLGGARAIGIEYEPTYCNHARRAAAGLNLRGVAFIEGDARVAPLDDGTVYFMYTPFRGALLQAVLDRLRQRAREQTIRVCTYGPGTLEVAERAADWLRPAGGALRGEHEVTLFQVV